MPAYSGPYLTTTSQPPGTFARRNEKYISLCGRSSHFISFISFISYIVLKHESAHLYNGTQGIPCDIFTFDFYDCELSVNILLNVLSVFSVFDFIHCRAKYTLL